MLALAGKNGRVLFTALPKQVVDQLSATLATVESAGNAASFAVHNETLLDLLECYNTSKEKICLLDPKAERELSPEDGDGRFDMLLFGVRAIFCQRFGSRDHPIPFFREFWVIQFFLRYWLF
jgi:hypothetical protein